MKFKKGDKVRLLTKPTGQLSRTYPLTVGKVYECHGMYGSNVITSCDEFGRHVDYNMDRVEKEKV